MKKKYSVEEILRILEEEKQGMDHGYILDTTGQRRNVWSLRKEEGLALYMGGRTR